MLSPVVVLAGAVLVSGVRDPAALLRSIALPQGLEWERLDGGDVVLRDFGEGGFTPLAPNWAMIFGTSGDDA